MGKLLTNTKITLSRGASTIYTGRLVEFDYPNRGELSHPSPIGGAITRLLFDQAGSTYQTNDIVTITAVQGDTVLPPVTRYRVGEVSHIGGRLPYVLVELTGMTGR